MFLDDTIPLNESSEAIVKVSDTDTVLFTGDISVVDLNILGTDEIGMTGGSLKCENFQLFTQQCFIPDIKVYKCK